MLAGLKNPVNPAMPLGLTKVLKWVAVRDMTTKSDRRRQTTDSVLLVTPSHFGFNPQTFKDNLFQTELDLPPEQIRAQAQVEFNNMVKDLQKANIQTIITPAPIADEPTYDEMFANNIYSFHNLSAGRQALVLHPVKHINRRKERQTEVVLKALEPHGTNYEIVDLTSYESQNKALEGTGSVVLDRVNMVAFAAISPRTDADVFQIFCEKMNNHGLRYASPVVSVPSTSSARPRSCFS